MKNHYVDNNKMYQAFVDHIKDCKEAEEKGLPEPKLPDYIGECFLQISERLSLKWKFINYTFRDEMIGDGIENCVKYWRNFNPDKYYSPFSYFTKIIYWAFVRRIKKEKNELYIRYREIRNLGILDEHDLLSDDGNMRQFEVYDNIIDFIDEFEKSKEKKKVEKTKPKGLEKFIGGDNNE